MSGETQVDREALGRAIRQAVPRANGFYGELTHDDGLRAADAVLALIPAPHPQGGTEALRALADEYGGLTAAFSFGWIIERLTERALLAAAPAPTEGES